MSTTANICITILTGMGILPAARQPQAAKPVPRSTLEVEHEVAMAAKRKPRDMREEWRVIWGE